jgi:RNA polymerase sigma factor (sigma-70 family)
MFAKIQTIKKNICTHRLHFHEKKLQPMTEDQKQLVEKNKGLIYFMVSKYPSIYMANEDMIAEAFYLTCRVAQEYKPEINVKFSTVVIKSWRRHLKRISDICSAKRNGYKVTQPWRQIQTDDGSKIDEDFATEPTHFQPAELKELEQIATKIFHELPQQMQSVLEMRKAGMTLESIGKKLGKTKEGIRYTESEAIKHALEMYRIRTTR